jgi:protein-disulfide isomerase
MIETKPWYKRPFLVAGSLLGGLVALIILFLIGETIYFMIQYKQGKLKPVEDYRSQALRASLAEAFKNHKSTPEELRRLEGKDNPALGNPDAKVRIVEFVDYDCPYCQRMASVVRDYLKLHPHDVYLVLRDFPSTELHPYAEDSAVAARCVLAQGQDQYWRYHDWLFANAGSRSSEALSAGALSSGADIQEFMRCFEARAGWQEIQLGLADGIAFGVSGTPTFFFNGAKMAGAMEKDFFEVMVDEARKRAEAE